jgi:cell wall-associated NlpC family hydrolase
MNKTEIPQRQAVVQEALTWLKTKYHHRASIKGAGVDCAMILVEVYFTAGVVSEKPQVEDYPPDFMLHRDEERYLGWLKKYGKETDTARPGDVITWKFGRCFSHGAIVVDYPTVVHAYRKCGMVTLDDATKGELGEREFKIFTFWDD